MKAGPSNATIVPRRLVLRDGRSARARLLTAADVGAVREFFSALSPETIRARYGYLIRNMSPEKASRLVAVDQVSEVALGIFTDGAGPPEQMLGMGRLVYAPDGQSAECAFVVRDDCRRLGLASKLLLALRLLGRQRGLPRLFAQVRQENRAMLAVFRQAGARLHFSPYGDVVEVDIPLQ